MKRLVFVIVLSCSPDVGERSPDAAAPPEVDFAKDIRPILDSHCRLCHYPGVQKHTGTDETGLDLSTLASLKQGGFHTGNGIVNPGAPATSALVRKLRGTFDVGDRMPKNGPPYLSEEQIRLVELWIEQGAKGEPDE
jgi:hypothetical protein